MAQFDDEHEDMIQRMEKYKVKKLKKISLKNNGNCTVLEVLIAT